MYIYAGDCGIYDRPMYVKVVFHVFREVMCVRLLQCNALPTSLKEKRLERLAFIFFICSTTGES